MTIPSDLTDENQVRAWDANFRALCDKYHSDKVAELDDVLNCLGMHIKLLVVELALAYAAWIKHWR